MKNTKRRRRVAVAIIFGIPLLLLLYTLIEARWLKVNRLEFVDPDIPAAFDGVTIAFMSDIHHGPWFSLRRVEKTADRVNRLDPDIVLLGGDYVHRSPKYIEPLWGALKSLDPKLGVFAVSGSHDRGTSVTRTLRAMKAAGITCADNHGEWIVIGGDRIKIGGVGDMDTDYPEIDPTIGDVTTDDFVILLSHKPDYIDAITTDKIDLMLSGHTHGGQVTLFGRWTPLVPLRAHNKQKFRIGFVETKHTKVYVTPGVGTVTPPVRFCCRPEIALITLRRK